jgi:hypothetical protein
MPHQASQRCFVQRAIAVWRDQRQPEAVQGRSKSVIGPSPDLSRRRDIKKPRPYGGVFEDRAERKGLSRASISSPLSGICFRQRWRLQNHSHSKMMVGITAAVNAAGWRWVHLMIPRR